MSDFKFPSIVYRRTFNKIYLSTFTFRIGLGIVRIFSSAFYPPSAFSYPRFILHPHFLIRILSSIRIFSSAFYPPSAFSHPRFILHPHFLIRIFSSASVSAIRIRIRIRVLSLPTNTTQLYMQTLKYFMVVIFGLNYYIGTTSFLSML